MDDKQKILTVEMVRNLIKYDFTIDETLLWKDRSSDIFKGSKRGPKGDAAFWNKRNAGKEAFTQKSKQGYYYGHIFDIKYYKHRIIWLLHYGEWPTGPIDHINGIKTDNRIENLRLTNDSENQKNTFLNSKNTSGQVGVRKINNPKYKTDRFEARICNTYLGVFKTFEEAVAARKEAEIIYGFSERHGEVRK